MAPQLTDGVPGVEGIHVLTPPSPFSSFALNDWMDPSTGLTRQWTEQAAWSELTDVQGIHDMPDQNDPRVQLNYQIGEMPLPRYPRGRTITYSGWVAAQTLSDMRSWVAACRAACASGLTQPTAWMLNVQYDPTYDTSGLVFGAYGVPTAFTCDDSQPSPVTAPSPYVRQFTLTFRQSDGRWWVTPSGFACSVGSSGSPIAAGSSGTLTMTGTAPSEPTFYVYGSGSGSATITLANETTGDQLQFVLPSALSTGDLLTVNFGTRTAMYTPDGTTTNDDYSGYIDWANSPWWQEIEAVDALLIGDNSLKVTGDTWACAAMPACW